jgi:hypothetical protein
MKLLFRAVMTAALSVALVLGAAAQAATTQAKSGQTTASKSSGGEKTVEEAYLQESAESMMVKELSRSDDRDGKLVALAYARKAMDGGRKTEEIRNSLQYLALENTQVIARVAGLGVSSNNFPDVRKLACEYLGDFPSVETKDTLVSVILNSKTEDPMVLAEAIRSLGRIGMNDNDEVVDAIAYSVNHFANVGMSEDRLAVYTCFAFQELMDKGGVKDIRTVTNTIMKFKKGSYITSVKKVVDQTLEKLAGYQAKNSNNGKDNSAAPAATTSSPAKK